MTTSVMKNRPTASDTDTSGSATDPVVHARRWWILAVLCVSLLVTGIDGTIVNVALPTLVRDLGATSSQLQWVVDAYTLVFASLLLMAGNTGDRHGRKKALLFGLATFGTASAIASQVDSAQALIALRAVQGFGAAFLMPATLSILTDVFRDPPERTRAIAIWSGVTGLGVALGPLTGGWLLDHFAWGSIFLVNVPIIAIALPAAWLLVPDSRDPHTPPLDLTGVVLSIIGLVGLLYGIIEGQSRGWGDPVIVGAFVVATLFLTAFVLWELHTDHPILDMNFFRNPRFTAASIAVTLVFFAMFGSLFFLSQYMQFVLGYDAFTSGLALIPVAVTLMIAAPTSAKLVGRFGTKIVVTAGLVIVAAAMLLLSNASVDSGYGFVAATLITLGLGMGLAMAPATDSIMGSLPPSRAGVGSAVNDTTREIGAALGVAVLGTITASSYTSHITTDPTFAQLKHTAPTAAAAVSNSIGGAAVAASHLPAAVASQITEAAKTAFVSALDTTVLVAAVVALLGAAVAAIFLPARANRHRDDSDLVTAAARKLGPVERRSVADATLSTLADAGLASLTVNGIAARSGVATATIQHVWTSRLDAVVEALDTTFAPWPPPATGSFTRDCDAYLDHLAAMLSRPGAARVVATLVGEAARDPSLAPELRARVVEPRRQAVRTIVQQAKARDDLPENSDADLIADVLAGPLFHRLLITGAPITATTGHDLATLLCFKHER
jgi:EmrB/QacA subfamily drug resistance transporter